MRLRYLPHYTYEDYLKWQGDWELVEGIPYAMASPEFPHQKAFVNLLRYLADLLEEKECNCFVVGDLDWIASEDTVLRPDLVVLCEEPQDYIRKTPELVIEIVSDSSKFMDELVKFEKYEELGVPYYVLVYPETKSWKAYENSQKGFKLMERLSFKIKDCQIELDINRVWR